MLSKLIRVYIFLIAGILLSYTSLQASHNLAGQITYKRLGPNFYEILLTTYTDPTAAGVDRCTADIEIWGGQGTNKTLIEVLRDVPRENGNAGGCESPARMGIFIRPTIKKNYYRATFRFNGPGVFELRYRDVARINNVINIANSGNTAFYVATTLNNNPFIGDNNSPLLLNDPLDDACTNKLWTHNPGGYDPDGDSLVYSLINCQQYDPPNLNTPISVANYQFPGSFGGAFTIDRQTGLVTWNTPQTVGIYNISILIEEYRDGRKIGYVIRDMAIFVKPCNNKPPIIEALRDTCVKAGAFVSFPVRAYDPDPFDSLYFYLNNGMELNNGPFAVPISPASLSYFTPNVPPPVNYPVRTRMPQEVIAQFDWQTDCSHIRSAFYQVDFYAHDNFGNNPTLAANHVTKIRVVPESVTNLNATPGSRKITLNWDPHPCTNAIGYEIYRNEIGAGEPDTACCKGGLKNYKLLAYNDGYSNTTYVDAGTDSSGLEYRERYCYKVIAMFVGNVRSCASKDTCLKILRDMPVIVRDSVIVTDNSAGLLQIRWTKPKVTEIDTNFFPAPYTYRLYEGRGVNTNSFNLIASNINFEDTAYISTTLNTEATGYRHRVYLHDANERRVSGSPRASSVYLSTIAADRAIRLVWKEYVPWLNKQYFIFRSDNFDGPYNQIATVNGTGGNQHSYIDRGENGQGLEIGKTYCYFVRSRGTFNTDEIDDTYLFNDSNRRCDSATDTVPPCLPGPDSIFVKDDCENFLVEFKLIQPDSLCAGDLKYYSVYFSRTPGGPYTQLVARTTHPDSLRLTVNNAALRSIAGCFVITATDTIVSNEVPQGNESPPSQEYCFDNCPVFTVPNVMSLNGDGINDVIRLTDLTKNRGIKSVFFRVYDRWGMLIHDSRDPENLWNGSIKNNGTEVLPGYYFYTIDVTLDNIVPVKIIKTGGITVLR